VPRDAGQDEIKRAYRKLARKYHPDINKEADAEKHFKEVGEAYEVLKDPEKRAAYDQFGSNWQEGQEFKPPPNWDAGFEFSGGGFTDTSGFSDFFEHLFGRAGSTGPFTRVYRGGTLRAKGEDHHAKIMVGLEDAFHGATRTVTLTVSELDGHGRIITRPHSLHVKIPKGIMEGQRIRLAEQGGPGLGGGPNGDLYLEINFQPHSYFRAEKRDIYLDLPVTPWEAALGGTVPVPTLGGTVELKIPAGSQTGRKLRLKGRGLPGHPAGDQYVVLKIITPSADTQEAQVLYKKMAETMPMNPRADLGV